MFELQNCEILRLDKNYRGELFPRELDNSALTVYINVSILAFPKVLNNTIFSIFTFYHFSQTD